MVYIPNVIEETPKGERAMDLYSRLLADRIIFIGTPIDDTIANMIVAQLIFLRSQDPKKAIHIYINSPGGVISAGLAIYDTMNFLECDIHTYCIGMAASMGAVLLCAGTPGKRFVLPNSRVMNHQPLGGVGGSAAEIATQAKEIIKMKQRMAEILAKHTGQTVEKIRKDSERDNYMSAEEAKAYGMVDEVIVSSKEGEVISELIK
ncbi:MAG: ATP-dependent Clp protease proteolytic subunit [Chlamydiia bacterium]|nr:ATP-dependent Clp protease proteolytic subunit [Chlamydiia bacterium]